jgi:hypothetical protein
LVRLIGGGFYRPERQGRGRRVARRCGGPGRVRRATLGTTALLACWRGSVSAAECCGSALAQSRWSATVTLKVDPGLVSSHSRERLRLSKAGTRSAVGVVKWCLLYHWCLNRLRTLKLYLHRILLLCSHRSGYGIPSSCRLSLRRN